MPRSFYRNQFCINELPRRAEVSAIQLSGEPIIKAGVHNGESMSESPTMEKIITKFPMMVKCPSMHGHKEKMILKTPTMAKCPCRHEHDKPPDLSLMWLGNA